MPPRRDEYHVGIICALAIESAAVVSMLDERYSDLRKAEGDDNDYVLGRIGNHSIVVACLPAGLMGNGSAAVVASNMRRSFPVKIGLMVGVGGGIWSKKNDIRLGDVVVSQPEGQHGGVVQWDFGQTGSGGHFVRKGSLNKPPPVLLHALQAVKRDSYMRALDLQGCLTFMVAANPYMGETCRHPGVENDRLYLAFYDHFEGDTCDRCDPASLQSRPARTNMAPRVHYGNIASGNQVMKHGLTRDAIATQENVICFEMEAAGLMDTFPCLVIRGICDYADSHKNKNWQPYAAATSAAFARILLLDFIKQNDIVRSPYASEVSFSVPFSQNKNFVGRENELRSIEPGIVSGGSNFAIFGLGGIGKTQITLELAHRTRKHQPDCSVFWIPSTNKESFRQAYDEISQDLHLTEDEAGNSDTMPIVHRYLSHEKSGQWLMILDNADDYDMWFNRSHGSRIMDYVPQSSKGCVVMTTRDQRVAIRFADRNRAIELTHMDEETATQMLRNIINQEHLLDDQSSTSLLLAQLCYLPLAIMQAAAYLNMNYHTVDVSEYLSLLKGTDNSWIALLSEDFDDDARYQHQQNTIINTWLISFDKIRQQRPVAAEYLACISFFDPKGIPESLLPPATTREEGSAAIACLYQYSFIRKQTNGTFDMHGLVHLIMRNWLKRNHNFDSSSQHAIEQLAGVFDDIPAEDRGVWRPYLPHIKHALSLHSDPEEKIAVGLLSTYGTRLSLERRYEESEECLRKVLEIRTRVLGEADDLTILSRHRLVDPIIEEHRYKEVEELYQELVRISSNAFGPEHAKTLSAMNLVGWTLWKQRHWDRAQDVFASIIPLQERTLGRGHPDTLRSKRNLVANLDRQRRWKEAENILLDILETERDLDSGNEDGSRCPSIYDDKEDLADILWEQNRREEAQTLQKEVIESKSKVRGLERSTLESRTRLLSQLRDQERVQEANELEVDILREREKLLSSKTTAESTNIAAMDNMARELADHERWEEAQAQYEQLAQATWQDSGEEYSQTLHYRIQVAWTLYQQSQYDKAEGLLVTLVETTTTVLGPTHPDTLLSKSHLVATYLKQKRFQEANTLQFDVLQTKKDRLGEGDPSTLQEMAELANICQGQGATDEAVRIQEEQMELTKKSMGPIHPDTLASMETLAAMYHKNKRCKDAPPVEEKLLELMRMARGYDHPDTISLMERLADRFHNHGLREKEEVLHIEFYQLTMNAKGPEHPDTLSSMHDLASYYHKHGDCTQAEILQSLVYNIQRGLKGDDDPETLSSLSLLAATYGCLEKPEIAEPLFRDVIARQKMVLGPTNKDTLSSMRYLTKIFEAQKRSKEEEEQWVQIIEANKASADLDVPTLISDMTHLAWMFYGQERFYEAERLRVEVLEQTKLSHGPDHPETLSAMDQLGVMIWHQGRFQEAETIFTPLVESCKRVLPPGDLLTIRSSSNLGAALYDLGRFREAETQLLFVLQMGQGKENAKEVMMFSITRLRKIREKVGLSAEAIEVMVQISRGESDESGPSEELEVVEDPMEVDSMSGIETDNNATLKRKRV